MDVTTSTLTSLPHPTSPVPRYNDQDHQLWFDTMKQKKEAIDSLMKRVAAKSDEHFESSEQADLELSTLQAMLTDFDLTDESLR